MEQFRRRSDDHDGDSAQVLLARIDERVKGSFEKIKEVDGKLDSHLYKFDNHVKDDDGKFKDLFRNQYIGYGILMAINFIILFMKH